MTDPTAIHPEPPPDPSRVELAAAVWVHRDDLTYSFSRSSGPGGQSVNKLNTRAELRVAVARLRDLPEAAATRLRRLAGARLNADDQLVIVAETHRSQLGNRRACVERLADLVARALVEPVVRKRKRPSRAMKERRLAGKRERSEKKSRRRWRADGGA
ncbi:MAG: aminoacyl-tRNA hydrolase [Phycisphaerales bacterium]|nr:aminoacyl-tRNA hydrolase [Phycisphaerales bacterium]